MSEKICPKCGERHHPNYKRKNCSRCDSELAAPTGSALPNYGHLQDYVLDLHIITGQNGQCRCGEGGITCSERLRCVSHEIGSALLGANMAKRMGGEKFTSNKKGQP